MTEATMMVAAIFVFVYAGMIFGGIRGLALDRTGIVLLGAIAMVACGAVTPERAWASIDVPTISLLFGLMVVSAQFRLGGFYTYVSRKLGEQPSSPSVFLAQVIALSAVLSALLANDIVCLAVAPILIEICARRKLNPMPFLLGLACGSNIGSAATLIGNPQNMLIGQVLQLHFSKFFVQAIVPTLIGLVIAWGVIAKLYRAAWEKDFAVADCDAPAFNAYQTGKGALVLGVLVAVFLWGGVARDVAALAAAGVILLSRRTASPKFLGLVDWHLLTMFIGLFIVNHGMQESGLLEKLLGALLQVGVDLSNGAWLFATTVVLSNTVSNVPAVMLLLPSTQNANAGLILALASTFAGNMFLVGSIANIIVAEQAAKMNVDFSAKEHMKVGIPVTLATLLVAGGWIWAVV